MGDVKVECKEEFHSLSSTIATTTTTTTHNRAFRAMKINPIAVGPCRIYHRTADSRLAKCGPFYVCCRFSRRSDGGTWKECYIRLYSDSTLKIHLGAATSSKDQVTRIVLKRLYKEILFGVDLKNLMDRPDVPHMTNHQSWDSVLAIPDEPYCNGSYSWLDFTSQETLFRWLVAMCSTLPVTNLKVLWRNQPEALDIQQASEESEKAVYDGYPLNSSLRAHIDLFFSKSTTYGRFKRKSAACYIELSRTSLLEDKEILHTPSTSTDV